MTLKNIILEQTGMRTPQFCERYGFSEATIQSWSLQKSSEVARNPKSKNIEKLAFYLDVDPDAMYYFFENRWL